MAFRGSNNTGQQTYRGMKRRSAKAKKVAKTTLKAEVSAAEAALPAWRVVTREQLAAAMGIHPDTVTDNVRHGMPILRRGGAGKEGAYDLVACLAWQREQLGKNKKDNAQTRVFDLTADLKKLELDLEMGRLVVREQVVKEVQAFGKGLQAMIRALPRQCVQA